MGKIQEFKLKSEKNRVNLQINLYMCENFCNFAAEIGVLCVKLKFTILVR